MRPQVNPDGSRCWSLNGCLHRADGPAIEWPDGSKTWWLHGLRHRDGGPAIEWDNGREAWFLDGKYLTREAPTPARRIAP